ncbi:MAG: UDP-N-acetylmuramate dehydrogenase [Candidatus Omnitrophota bacterium]|nr:UDP-N-acetylmuramate dehydrogenase [Candidatus Omnitrophota bacterium]
MLRYNELLSGHTSFRIGGPAYYWAEPENIESVLEAVSLAEDKNKRLLVVGKGTNLLVKDEGFDGVIISLAGDFEKIEKGQGGSIKAGAGASVSKLVKYAFEEGLGGCEFLSGIPGSLGGAIFMNAGVRAIDSPDKFEEIKDILTSLEALDLKDKKIKILDRKDVDFGYRHSGLSEKIILGARFSLKKDKKENIRERISAFNKKREWLAKIGFPNAGSIFKNPASNKPAGMLIESCGLKGKRIGGAEISSAHANVIMNVGKATAKDVLSLMDLARIQVKQKFGIDLEPELKIV